MFLIITFLCFTLVNGFIFESFMRIRFNKNNNILYKNTIDLLQFREQFLEMIPRKNNLIFFNNSNSQDNSTGTCEVKLPPNRPRPIEPTIQKSLFYNEDNINNEDKKLVKKVYLIEKINCYV